MKHTPRPAPQRRTPPIVSKILERGTNATVGILRTTPTCVLKWPHPNDDAMKSFEAEKRVLNLLGRHRFVVQLLWASETGLCFEYHPFRSIRHYYRHNEFPAATQRYRWCHQLVSGFAYIHSKNIIHHDISTRNVLLSSGLNVQICDFGSATLQGEEAHGLAEFRYSFGRTSLSWEATFQYDLFCMGALFYEIILGKVPNAELNRSDVVERFKRQSFPSLDEIEPGYAAVIDNCWHDKYSSIQQLEAGLPSFQDTNLACNPTGEGISSDL